MIYTKSGKPARKSSHMMKESEMKKNMKKMPKMKGK